MQTTKISFLLYNDWISSIKDGIDSLIGIYHSDVSKIITANDDEILLTDNVYVLGKISSNSQMYLICDPDTYINDAKGFVESIYGISDSYDTACKLLAKFKTMNFGDNINFKIYLYS